MLTVSPLTNSINARQSEMEAAAFSMEGNEFPNLSTGNLLDNIDFDDLFVGISDGDSLPDLEMDSEILAEFSCVAASIGDEFEMTVASPSEVENSFSRKYEDKAAASVSASDLGSGTSTLIQGDEIASKRAKESGKVKKPSTQSKNLSGKKKVKVDWTPELHRRFVQAVEQLGVDKAVPSRILEIMGIDCLTRHNIASHLQKYRSHRKHLLAREAEAATWSQRRHIYGATTAGGGVPRKRDVNPWNIPPPTIGFPPVTPMAHFRPLHVWGHPSVGHSMWPQHITPSPPPPHTWPPTQPRPLVDHAAAFWHSRHQHVPTPGTPCYPPHLPPTRFPAPPVPAIPPPAMYKIEPDLGLQTVHHGQTLPRPPCDVHPSKESVDAAIGDVLSKPWLPLPLGLKPPSMDSVMGELQRQGVSKIPPTCS